MTKPKTLEQLRAEKERAETQLAQEQHISTSAAALCMIFVMLPCFLLAMYEKQGLPLEKILRNMIRVYFIRPKHRPYETNNFYSALARQEKLDKEVQRIVYGKAAHRSRQAAD